MVVWSGLRQESPGFGKTLEILELSRDKFKLGVEEYYELGVFDDTFFPGKAKVRCVGWRGSAMVDQRS